MLSSRWVRDLNPCRRICSPLPRLSANPPWRPTCDGRPLRADDEARTRDLNLGKVALYQLSYVRLFSGAVSRVPENEWNSSTRIRRGPNRVPPGVFRTPVR